MKAPLTPSTTSLAQTLERNPAFLILIRYKGIFQPSPTRLNLGLEIKFKPQVSPRVPL